MSRYLFVPLSLAPLAAFAEVPGSVTSSLTAALSDATTVAAAVIGIVVAIAAFRYMKKAL